MKLVQCPKCGHKQKVHSGVIEATHQCNPNIKRVVAMKEVKNK